MNHHTIIHAVWLSATFLALFGMAELLYHKFKIQAEYTRKIVHIGTGLLTFLFPLFLDSHWWVLVLCSAFALILIASIKFNLLKSIHAVDRETRGSLCYPIAVYGCFLAFELNGHSPVLYYLPILILAVCDPLAALFGRKWPRGKYSVFGNHKSLLGSAIFAISAFCIAASFLSTGDLNAIKIINLSFAIAIVSSIAEAVSSKGYDNLTIPGTVLVMCLLFL